MRVGGPAAVLVEVGDVDELVDAAAGLGRDDYLVMGAGSNLVVSDAGVEQPVIALRSSGIAVRSSASDDEVRIVVASGEGWDELVERAVGEGWSGVEALAGIPGSVGATPIQNVGAYGQEVADVISRVVVLDRRTGQLRPLGPDECGFRYRGSRFKDQPERFVVVEVELTLHRGALTAPVRYAELAARLGVAMGDTAPASEVRDAVIDLRRSKGMVLDDSDQDSWSAGSFFTNPLVSPQKVPAAAPSWPLDDGLVKVSAAWLIEQAGFPKGFGADVGTGRARLSTKHALAITNRGGATAADVALLARTVRQGVIDSFGVVLAPEPTLVGIDL
jgi:UDP-N-acetylmuramate dehydrogenase